KYGYNFPFEYTHDITSSADIAFANLEAPISKDNGKKRRKQFTFKAHPDTVKSLLYAGFDVLNIANNHIMDFGRDALSDTIRILEENNIQYVGGGKNFEDAHTMRIIKVRGSLIGFLGFSKTYTAAYYAGKNRAGITSGGEGNILKLVKENSKKVDILIVSFHWGKEYTWKPGSFQISLARRIIKNGAKAVLGHHPHCIQPVEKYKDGIIAYSLGNFAFGSFGRPPKRKADKSLMLKIHLDKKKIAGVEVIPLDVYNYRVKFQSRVPENKKLRDEILNYIKKISARFNTAIQIEDGRGYIPF
ncbi:MAG: CapA family protein, partial [Spirochaetes bacterium]|nr:CapA family protein [Spirochaetota bacterium]